MGFWTYFDDQLHWLESDKTERDCCCDRSPSSDGPSYECPTCGYIPHAVVEYAHMGGFARVIFKDGPYKNKIDWVRCYDPDFDPARTRLADLPHYIKTDTIEGRISDWEMSKFAGDLRLTGSFRNDEKLLIIAFIERELGYTIDLDTWHRQEYDRTIRWLGHQIYEPDFDYPSQINLYPYKLKRP